MTTEQKKQYQKISVCSHIECGCVRKIDKRSRAAIYSKGKQSYGNDIPACYRDKLTIS